MTWSGVTTNVYTESRKSSVDICQNNFKDRNRTVSKESGLSFIIKYWLSCKFVTDVNITHTKTKFTRAQKT